MDYFVPCLGVFRLLCNIIFMLEATSSVFENFIYLSQQYCKWLKILWLDLNSEPETEVIPLEEDGKPEERVELALTCLPEYDPAKNWTSDSSEPFRYWNIRDYAYAYRSKLTTPSIVSTFLELSFLSLIIIDLHF